MTKPILVTSAAGGTQGRTGRHVSEMLLERGARVRAFVRQIDERSDRLKSLGAEIFVGDFLDVRSVEQAAKDVSAIYFAYPVQDGLADATAAMAFAARKHGVSRLVNLVMYQSSIDAPTPRMRQNYLSEQVFEWAGVGPVHLRATVFYENVARLVGAGMPAQGAIRLPLGDESTILPLISAEDVSRIAVGLLTGPERAAGTAYPVIGSAISIKEIVGSFCARPQQGHPLRGDHRRAVAERGSRARLECACGRTSVLALEVAAGRQPFRGGRPVRRDGHDRENRRRQAEDVRTIRSRAAVGTGGAAGGCACGLGGRRDHEQTPAIGRGTGAARMAGAPDALSSKASAATAERDGKMSKTNNAIIECNGIHINIAEQGEGPLVLLVHGFPESWFSWRHQIDALAAAGFRVVAPDMRGYGKSDAPQAIDQYTILHLVGDMVGILDALGAATAVIVGHDWGASVAWQAALMRPDRFRAVAALSVPFRPRGKAPPTSLMPRTENAQFYQLYFQEQGAAEAELDAIRARPFATCCSGRPAMAWPRPARRSLPAGPHQTSAWCRRAADFCRDPAHPKPCRPGSRKRHRFLRRGI